MAFTNGVNGDITGFRNVVRASWMPMKILILLAKGLDRVYGAQPPAAIATTAEWVAGLVIYPADKVGTPFFIYTARASIATASAAVILQ